MSDSMDKWEIFQDLSDELKRNIRLAVVLRGSAIYVTKDDEVFGFGQNEEGFLGTGDRTPRTEHTKIKQLCGQNIQGLQFSNCTFFAISASGSVFSWGNNDFGQLGLGTTQETLIPTKIEEGMLGIKRVQQVACSSLHTLALTSDREVFSFGHNDFGQLGLGHNYCQTLPIKLDLPAAGRVVTSVACLYLSSVALLDSGEVFAWGSNAFGILGQSENQVEKQNIPRKVPGLDDGIKITRIVSGQNHVLALSNDGKVYSWGWNKYGLLGNGTRENSYQPTLLFGNIGRIRDVAAHFESDVSAVVTEADDVYIWGYLHGRNIMSPAETSITSLDEVYAKIPNGALTFRPLRPKLDEPIEDKKTTNKSYEWLKKSFNRAETADVVFVVEGKKIHAHKTILIMQCAVFETMFLGDWEESHEREQIIEDHSYDVFYAFLRYFYTNEVDLQPDLALELFDLAHFYVMTDLQKDCLKIFKRGVTVENAAWIYDQAIQLDVEVPI
ncbi:RCC1 and BTB domain-containing protein 1-like [Cloeon dipterum]|uniref:RCC1 and BTB domain-containing protein 1-like n=1 Tax=Cloeon dipterum TaxID=197152 RepID=UPI00321F9651